MSIIRHFNINTSIGIDAGFQDLLTGADSVWLGSSNWVFLLIVLVDSEDALTFSGEISSV